MKEVARRALWPSRFKNVQSTTQNNYGGRGSRGVCGGFPHPTSSKGSDSSLAIFDIVAEGSDNGLCTRTLDKIVLHMGKTFPKYMADLYGGFYLIVRPRLISYAMRSC